MLSHHIASESSCPARTLCRVSQRKAAVNPGPDSHYLLQQLAGEPALGAGQHRPRPDLSSLQREAYPQSPLRNSRMIGMGIWSHIRSEAI